ncbi:acetyl-CoA carboxylase carboxyl transferase subunit alpha [Thalassospira sp. MBR-102]|jgi:acetyl-CoA carboxylase carboxyl transferase subunit alpha|uniref:Acetyl-coenzyme A carboxylase carboxyl transferase subunit alpha n=3 Tax=Thalassospira TaxID=168934 RepID=A0A285RV64_9PROT|nr:MULTISPECIES: acetyl-CoA carboxylase carboxyltransferase subunit alpha [Thalassospira]MBR9782235.1 acetyl-CoA carboxylase carboxyltransferase subunit alpha [Rhodospirillales bacterium]AJD50658.1 acetyl-CoA carboxylase carboxyltransferase subunit alpha [Thalassospira xiamenensis M-5 = DSM 17429]KEO58411.1 acetyl-CoA carboxylase subunit alpha [Thalassospira permensis NBRC 106175]KZD02725.1 acetyl-CoA carboxylase carboxyl transferase subunit alpha [Thalassospira xiamenensis]KZD09929.1 acetyl-C|tara:strand:+ start:866 stop:1822 length:957 start_codon:yes stop_codon:yes gene_type:complete|eukprot:TRINITY_DN4613_c0_g2_i1.p1 TRINITY_DN4613_c0_g2~~TRINITY_DN4613_c0_g2_i1.p1  ORF type:complete len:319 (-),score=116.80 TRINITY_DN4613_c0_g2_i1:1076-2032(-)
MHNFLDFEKPIAELEGKIEELRHLTGNDEVNIADEVARLQDKLTKLLQSTYGKLTAWQKTQVARHPDRPHFTDYVAHLFEGFTPLAGDRLFGEDEAIIGGLARLQGRSVMVIGHEKGRDTESRVKHNFGMAKPEGYRKAIRLMRMAERFGIPVITLVDTAGAFPGADAEARGQSEAIARSIEACLDIKVPLISVIIGEGGSGGAIALAVANSVMMLENSIYSVISPEGCASILWRSGDEAKTAAEALRLTAQDLHQLGVIDEIITEPLGGAQRSPVDACKRVGTAIVKALEAMDNVEGGVLKARRRDKFLDMGRHGLN